jgi:hypothetical protein
MQAITMLDLRNEADEEMQQSKQNPHQDQVYSGINNKQAELHNHAPLAPWQLHLRFGPKDHDQIGAQLRINQGLCAGLMDFVTKHVEVMSLTPERNGTN